MKKYTLLSILTISLLISAGCSKAYKVKPMPFKIPASYGNSVDVAGAEIAAEAFTDPVKTKDAFGFDILGAKMLPVQVVFDNQGPHALEIDGAQTFLEDAKGNLWPILSSEIAHERATKYAKTGQIVKEGASKSLWGAAAGSIIGAAVGIVTGDNVAEAAGIGAAVGAAAGATAGGMVGYSSDDARRKIATDLRVKSLQNRSIEPKNLAYGFLFFPGEANSAIKLRLRLVEEDTGDGHVVVLGFRKRTEK
ncbi:hypothetical protein BuS5_03837 [Desulfosarcina sp. BuS5]|uniref:glycine zipper domain-containing protein n=1 Tax=Desulfosarcina sp. BuS5 TaxID=933262 RepID=UPI0004818853|nr:glycine zipper domain-containing protein [Desulfosarcina sp. BuS5]WDN90866.1 hypothetical protein BuS5_03837 [Desulfosarcina sp. BuS5]